MRGWLYTLYRPCASLQDLDHLDRDLSDVLPTLINFCSEPKSWPKTQHQLLFSQTVFVLQKHTSWFFHKLFLFCKNARPPADFFTNYFYFAKNTKNTRWFFHKTFLFCKNTRTPADFSQNYFYFAKTQKHQLIFSQYFYLAKNTKTPADFFHKTILILLKHKNISWFFHKVFLFCKSTKTPTDFFHKTILILLKHKNTSWFPKTIFILHCVFVSCCIHICLLSCCRRHFVGWLLSEWHGLGLRKHFRTRFGFHSVIWIAFAYKHLPQFGLPQTRRGYVHLDGKYLRELWYTLMANTYGSFGRGA